MNILPKKNWHVRNHDNRERVRKDEEKARGEELKEQERIALTEQEVRIRLLRKKQGHEVTEGEAPTSKHFNLFEQEAGLARENVDHKKEKEKEKEDYEKKIGLLTYVAQSAVEAKEQQPWYLEKKKDSQPTKKEDIKDDMQKSKLDPLAIVESSLKSKKEKKKKKKKIKSSSSSGKKSIDELRRERLEREKKEREKANRLINGEPIVEPSPDVPADRYSSQFNPHLARQNRKRYQPY